MTPSEQERQQEVTAAVAQIAENRAAIDQAKGMLMLAYGIDAQAAFAAEVALSTDQREAAVPCRAANRRLMAPGGDDTLPPRSAYDNLLLTAHERIPQA